MQDFHKKLWIWGTFPGLYNIPLITEQGKRSYMSAMEAALYMGAENLIMATYGDQPYHGWSKWGRAFVSLDKVLWTVAGVDDASYRSNTSDADLQELIRIAPEFPNIAGGLIPAFRGEQKKARYTEKKCLEVGEALQRNDLEYWCEYAEDAPGLEKAQGVVYMEKDLTLTEAEFIKKVNGFIQATPGKKRLIGLWLCERIGDSMLEISIDKLAERLTYIEEQIEKGNAEGLVLAPSSIMDVDLASVEFAREWVQR